MNKLQRIITRVSILILSIILSLYVIIRLVTTFFRSYPKGDESSFLETFKIFIERGYYEANIHGNSILFNLFSYVFYKMGLNELLALKATSLLFGILAVLLLLIYQKKAFKSLPETYKYVSLLTSLNVIIVMSFIFTGINDSLLSPIIVLFFIVLHHLKNTNMPRNYFYFLIGAIFALLLLTREMGVLFFPPIIILLLLYYFNNSFGIKKVFKYISITIFSFVFIVGLFNYPSIKQEHKLSFHEKKLDSEISWIQLTYLSLKKYYEGELAYDKYVSIKEVKEYLKENGEKSLPNTLVESLTFDIGMTTKIFFNEYIHLIKPFFRLLGVFFIFNLFIFIYYLFRGKLSIKKLLKEDLILFLIIYTTIICIVIKAHIDPRWFLSILILLPFVFATKIFNYGKRNNIKNFDFIMLNMQLISLIAMNIPFIVKNIHIIF